MSAWRNTAVRLALLILLACVAAGIAPAESGTEKFSPVLLRNGGSFLYLVREDGSIVGWGDNRKGQLGAEKTKLYTRPTYVATGIDGNDLRDIQCGNENTLFLMKDGTVYTCGTGAHGTQGLGKLDKSVKVPTQIPSLSRITKVACGFGHNIALDEDGHVWIWGRNDHGQLGTGNKKVLDTPAMMDLERIVNITCGGKFTMVQDEDGNIYGWGSNEYRVLEDSARKNIMTPMRLEGLDGHHIVDFAGGSDMAFWLDDEGVLWSRGRNENKQCGSRDGVWKVSPALTRVDIPEKVKTIIGYSSVPIVLTENGNVYVWGCTTNGQIGNGTAPGSSYPAEGWSGGDCVQVAAGSIFTSMMTADGRVYVTGYNSYGQLGNGTKRETCFWTWNGTVASQTGDPLEAADAALEEAGK